MKYLIPLLLLTACSSQSKYYRVDRVITCPVGYYYTVNATCAPINQYVLDVDMGETGVSSNDVTLERR